MKIANWGCRHHQNSYDLYFWRQVQWLDDLKHFASLEGRDNFRRGHLYKTSQEVKFANRGCWHHRNSYDQYFWRQVQWLNDLKQLPHWRDVIISNEATCTKFLKKWNLQIWVVGIHRILRTVLLETGSMTGWPKQLPHWRDVIISNEANLSSQEVKFPNQSCWHHQNYYDLYFWKQVQWLDDLKQLPHWRDVINSDGASI